MSLAGNALVSAAQCPNAVSEVRVTFVRLVDCDGNGSMDYCDVASGSAPDCNFNGVPGPCEVASGTEGDCDGDGRLDWCEVALDGAPYENGNCTPDPCEFARGDFGLDGTVEADDLGYLLAA